MPPGVRTLLAGDAPVALGWQSPHGPLALPARWRGSAGELETSAAVLALAGAASGSPASVCAERSRYRLKSKQGILLAGAGHARTTGVGSVARVTLDTHRATWWQGEDSDTVAARRG